MSVCGGWSLVHHQNGDSRAISLWCRAWTCPDCFWRRLRRLKREAQAGQPTTFLTLTVNPATYSGPDERAMRLSHAFRAFIRLARKTYPAKPIDYLAVFETTKRGEPHLHVLMRAPYIPQRWISALMSKLINAPIVDISKVHDKRHVAAYVAKYISKGPHRFGTTKRYWSSPGYHLQRPPRVAPADDGGSRWYVQRDPLLVIADQWCKLGYAVEWINSFTIAHTMGALLRGAPWPRPP